MTVITFDKLAYVDRLVSAGIPEKDARAHADSLDVALREQVATKADLVALGSELRTEFRAEIGILKAKLDKHDWMLGTLLIVSLGILGRLLFVH